MKVFYYLKTGRRMGKCLEAKLIKNFGFYYFYFNKKYPVFINMFWECDRSNTAKGLFYFFLLKMGRFTQ